VSVLLLRLVSWQLINVQMIRVFMVYLTFSSRKPHWHTQVYWLMWRSTVDSSQNKSSHLVQIAVFLVRFTSMLLWFSLLVCVGWIECNLN
jgi:hypothetical protein